MRTAIFLISLMLAGCGGKSELQKVRIASSSAGLQMGWLPLTMAQTLGYYKEEGLDVEVQSIASTAKTLQALLGGSVDVAGISYVQTIQMAAEGQRVRSFFLMHVRDSRALVVAPKALGKIKTVGDLKGAVIGVPAPGSPTHQLVNFYLGLNGVKPTEVSAVAIGAGGSAFAAVESGRVDAAALSGAEHLYLLHRHPEMRVLVDASTAEGMRSTYGDGAYAGSDAAAKQEWLTRNPETARRMTRALLRAQQWLVAHQPEEIRERLPEWMKTQEVAVDLEIIRRGKEAYTTDGAMPKGAPENMRHYLDLTLENMRSAKIDLAATWTNEYLPGAK